MQSSIVDISIVPAQHTDKMHTHNRGKSFSYKEMKGLTIEIDGYSDTPPLKKTAQRQIQRQKTNKSENWSFSMSDDRESLDDVDIINRPSQQGEETPPKQSQKNDAKSLMKALSASLKKGDIIDRETARVLEEFCK